IETTGGLRRAVWWGSVVGRYSYGHAPSQYGERGGVAIASQNCYRAKKKFWTLFGRRRWMLSPHAGSDPRFLFPLFFPLLPVQPAPRFALIAVRRSRVV